MVNVERRFCTPHQVQLSLRHALPQLEQNKDGLAKKCEERSSGKSLLGLHMGVSVVMGDTTYLFSDLGDGSLLFYHVLPRFWGYIRAFP